MGQLGIDPDKTHGSWMRSFLQVSESKMRDFNSQDLSNTIYAMSQLGIRIEKLYSGWKDTFLHCFQARLHFFNQQDHSNSLYSLSVMNWIPSSAFLLENWEYIQLNIVKYSSVESKRQLILFNAFYKLHFNKDFISGDILKLWVSDLRDESYKTNIISTTEKEIFALLQAMRTDFQSSYFIESIGSIVDFFSPTQNTILQFDGPSHFNRYRSYNSSSSLQTRLLKGLEYRVIRLSYSEWILHKSDKSKIAYLQNLIEKSI
jgi:hypothetical protein